MRTARRVARPGDRCPLVPSLLTVPLPACVVQKETAEGSPTTSAHPARFSPDDKFSKQRVAGKKRFGLLPTQQAPLVL